MRKLVARCKYINVCYSMLQSHVWSFQAMLLSSLVAFRLLASPGCLQQMAGRGSVIQGHRQGVGGTCLHWSHTLRQHHLACFVQVRHWPAQHSDSDGFWTVSRTCIATIFQCWR